jgi:hypothetical protein
MAAVLHKDTLPWATPPFSVEFIGSGPRHAQWRIRDAGDNAVGYADTSQDALDAADRLNAINQPVQRGEG